MYLRRLACGAIGSVLIAACDGCGTLQTRPKRPFDTDKVLEAVNLDATIKTLIESYYTANVDQQQQKRQEIVNKTILIIDMHYHDFVEQFSAFKKRKDTLADATLIGLTGTATLIEPPGTSRILTAVAGGLTASNTSFNKNYFYEATVPVLITSMDAKRLTVRAEIVERNALPASQYSLEAALSDINRYYTAGTFEGAIDSIAQESAKQKTAAETKFETLREQARKELDAHTRKTAEVRDAIFDDTTQAAHVATLEGLMTQLGSDTLTNKMLTRVINTRRPGKPGLEEAQTIPQTAFDSFMTAPTGGAPHELDPAKRSDLINYLKKFSEVNEHLVAEAIVQFRNVIDATDGAP